MNTLHLDQKDFWRYPLERALLQPLLKDGTRTLTFEIELKVWKLDGVPIKLENKKTHSKIAGFFLHLFHKIRLCFSATYRKNFQAAKLKIENAPIEAKRYQLLSDLFSALDEAMRENDTIVIKGVSAKIGEIIGTEQLEQRIGKLLPLFRNIELQNSPRYRKIPLRFEVEDIGL